MTRLPEFRFVRLHTSDLPRLRLPEWHPMHLSLSGLSGEYLRGATAREARDNFVGQLGRNEVLSLDTSRIPWKA